MKKKTTSQAAYVVQLIQNLIDAFEDAYRQRLRGATEEQLLIQIDIFAADHKARHPDTPESVELAIRRAAQSGIEAADARVPLNLASTIMRKHLNASADEILRQCAN